jgi:hypothetical protein
MHTVDQHRHKRPFQPAITNYFTRSDFDSAANNDYDYDHDYDHNNHTLSRGLDLPSQPRSQQHLAPPVPNHVQSELLQVGMRVRKSVPEGYKTQPNKMTRLPSIQTTLSRPSTTTITLEPVPSDALHQRELLPFSGLHKSHSYADQPTTNIHLYTGATESNTTFFPLPAEAFSQPFFSSLDSGYESIVPSNPGKRSWHDEQDLSRSSFLFGKKSPVVEVDEVPVSPLSEIPHEGLPKARMVRVPKSRRRVGAEGDVVMDEAIGVEGRVVGGSGSDFEEADFLSGEVDMGGV